MIAQNWFGDARPQPNAAGLEAVLTRVSGWQALSITDSPQTMELRIVNRMPIALSAGPATLRLLFRPGILTAVETIVLAPQSEAEWLLAIRSPRPGQAQLETVLELVGLNTFTLTPGDSFVVRIDGISAAADGGSRATRVQLDYRGFFRDVDVEAAGTQLMHLPVLRRHESSGPPPTALRSASTAASGPFLAGFLNGADILNDGKTANALTIRIVNVSGQPIALSGDADWATRFFLSFRTGSDDARWGLLGTRTDHLSLAVRQEAWQVDNHTVRRLQPGIWGPRESLDFDLTVFSTAPMGDAQLILTYENLPDFDDGDLVLLAHLGPFAERKDGVRVLDTLTVEGGVKGPVSSGDGVRVLDTLTVEGGLSVKGPVSSGTNYIMDIAPATFTLGGSADTYYPVLFEDLAWARGELRVEVFLADTDKHQDGPVRGSMMARIECHSDLFGGLTSYSKIEARQILPFPRTAPFIGGFELCGFLPNFVLWLLGQTTYAWLANHPSRIAAPADFATPGNVSVNSTSYSYKPLQKPNPGFDALYVSISKTSGRDAGPVPSGAIVLWPKTASHSPLGWAICDGTQGTPDFRNQFPQGLVYLCKV